MKLKLTLITACVWTVLLTGSANAIAPTPLSIINTVNNIRINQGVAYLVENPTLDKIAQDKANDMCTRDYYAHNDPNGRSWLFFYQHDGYQYASAGENLAQGYTDNGSLMTAWVNSPEHYANIIDVRYSQVGAAVINCPMYQNRENNTIAVNEFASPKPIAKAQPALTTQSKENNTAIGAGIVISLLGLIVLTSAYILGKHKGHSKSKKRK